MTSIVQSQFCILNLVQNYNRFLINQLIFAFLCKPMIIELEKNSEQAKLLVISDPDSLIHQFKQSSVAAYEESVQLHNKFFTELQKNDLGKESVLAKIRCLASAHQTIILNFCVSAELAGFSEVGQLLLKMHLQALEINKWLIKNMFQLRKKEEDDLKYLRVLAESLNDKNSKQKTMANYYKVKQSTMFMSRGVDKQLSKMLDEMKMDDQRHEIQMKDILKRRQVIQRIQPSDNHQILLEAFEVISHQSNVFDRLNKNAKQSMMQNKQNLEIKPYSKLKFQIDEAMKQKISQALGKLNEVLSRYIEHKNVPQSELIKYKMSSFGAQVNFPSHNQQRLIREDKKKQEKLREAQATVILHKNRADKLEQLLRQKTKLFEQKLKARFEKSGEKQKQLFKKSVTNLTSMSQFGNEAECQDQSEDKVKKVKKVVQFKPLPTASKKTSLKRSDQNAYQKSLNRIKFQDELDDESRLNSSFNSIDLHKNNQLCLQVVNVEYQGRRSISFADDARYWKLQLCSLVYDVEIGSVTPSTPHVKNIPRNKSLLTITNIMSNTSKKDRDNDRKSSIVPKSQMSEFYKQSSQPKFVPIFRREKKRMTEQFFVQKMTEQEQSDNETLICIANKVATNQDISVEDKKIETESRDEIRGKNEPRQRRQALQYESSAEVAQQPKKNIFEALMLQNQKDQGLYRKNRNKLNQIVTELKKKKIENKQGFIANVLRQNGGISITPAYLLSLYLTEDNAMEAEIEFGVSVSKFINERNLNKQISPKAQQLALNEAYHDEVTSKVMKGLYCGKKRQAKVLQEIYKIVKYPLSYIKKTNMDRSLNKHELSHEEVRNFIQFITRLHYICIDRPCCHLREFFARIGVQLD